MVLLSIHSDKRNFGELNISKNTNAWISERLQNHCLFINSFYHFDPMSGSINAGGVNLVMNGGVFGMALGKLDQNE